MPEKIIITADNLSKIFKDKQKSSTATITALNNLTFSIQSGKITALIGPDSAGKTTLMRLICCLMLPTNGEMTVLGMDTRYHAQEIQDRISYMPQKFGLYEDLTVQENLNLYADMHGISEKLRQERFAKLLKMAGLTPFTKRLAGKLSGGMKQKLGLICTLVRSPDLLLLDEPTVGVDPLSRRELWEILLELVKSENLTVLVSTAYMDEAALCQNILVLHQGNLLLQGTPDILKAKAHNLCYKVTPPKNMPARFLQSQLLNNKNAIIDAVPEGGCVRFIKKKTQCTDSLSTLSTLSTLFDKLKISPTPIEERVEDGFMVLLHEQENAKNTTDEIVTTTNSFEIDLNSIDHAKSMDIVDIEVNNLVRKFGDFTAVANTSFKVHKGEVFGLLGPNGAGKTTTFRMLCGLLSATSGDLSVAGVNLNTARTQARAKIGYVAQKFSLYSNLSVSENLTFYAKIYGLNSQRLKERIAAVKEEFNLIGWENTPAGELPGGFKQRLSMAAALMHEPEILFLDEPTSGIDPLARRSFWQQITALSAKGTTVIITTHFMEEAEYCDRIMIQDKGRLLALGTPQEIRTTNGTQDSTMNEVFINIVEKERSQAVVDKQ